MIDFEEPGVMPKTLGLTGTCCRLTVICWDHMGIIWKYRELLGILGDGIAGTTWNYRDLRHDFAMILCWDRLRRDVDGK